MGVHIHRKPIVTDSLFFQVDASNKLGGNITDTKNIANPTQLGTFNNGLTVVNDAFEYDGVDDYIDFGDDNAYSFGDGVTDSPFSIEAWINMDSVTGFRILNKYAASNYEYAFDTGGAGKLQFFIFNNGSASVYRCRYQDAQLNTNQWYHVVATYSGVGGASAELGMKIYVDSVRVDDTTLSGGSYVAMNNYTQNLISGRQVSSYANGQISSLSIYNKELSLAEVQQNYQSGRHKFE